MHRISGTRLVGSGRVERRASKPFEGVARARHAVGSASVSPRSHSVTSSRTLAKRHSRRYSARPRASSLWVDVRAPASEEQLASSWSPIGSGPTAPSLCPEIRVTRDRTFAQSNWAMICASNFECCGQNFFGQKSTTYRYCVLGLLRNVGRLLPHEHYPSW